MKYKTKGKINTVMGIIKTINTTLVVFIVSRFYDANHLMTARQQRACSLANLTTNRRGDPVPAR
jgi:hypothetical protein